MTGELKDDARSGLTALGDIPAVVPVVTIPDGCDAVALARALCRGDLTVIEVVLRTPGALQAIERIAAEVPEARVGAGTVTTPAQVEAARSAGASFSCSRGHRPGSSKPQGIPAFPSSRRRAP